MNFNLKNGLEILQQTPDTLQSMVGGLSDEWISKNEGADSWCVYDIVGHLIHGEKTDWMPRLEIILSNREDKAFEVFDRFAQFEESKGKSLTQLLNEFSQLRKRNIESLKARGLHEDQLNLKGVHPEFGKVTARELLSTWVVHDLNHISQISRVMAHQYKINVGPWHQYLGILNHRK